MGMPNIHSPEIIHYPNRGQWLMRCHGCGARHWTEGDSEDEAKALAKAHGMQRYEEAMRTFTVVVAMRKDTSDGATELKEFESKTSMHEAMTLATRWMTHAVEDPRWWGWSFALLLGQKAKAPVILRALGAGTTAIEAHTGTQDAIQAGEIIALPAGTSET